MDTGRKEFILIVEDEKKISDIVKAYLDKEGFRIRVAENGSAALSLLKEHPDLIILDLMLPKMHGLEVLKFIRADMNLKSTPVVILSNAFMEGLNSVFSATKRKARGYRSTTHLITMLCFVAGKLRFPQF